MNKTLIAVLLNTVVTSLTLPAQVLTVDTVRARLVARIAETPGAQVGISIREIGTSRSLAINGDTLFHAASTMKVPVLFALFREFDAGRMKRDQTLALHNTFKSIVDGSIYSLDANEDSDSSVYGLIGTSVPLRDLAVRMITHSSNLATNALIERLDAPSITRLTRELGATQMMVRRGVEDDRAYQAGLNNTTSANDLVALFVALQEGKVAGHTATADMLAILEAQAFNEEIPAGLPAGTRVAHKTGSITATFHDAGLVYPTGGRPYAIAVLTRGVADGAVANKLIADCSRIVWEWLRPSGAERGTVAGSQSLPTPAER
ncbi:MAG: serine hydrolase [Gemmatimonadaceae bacterium]